MFAYGSNVDADHRRTDADAHAATVADTNLRSNETAGSRADVSAKPVSYNTTYRATVISTDWPAVRGADASTVSSADIVTDCPADRGADASTFSATDCVADCPSDRGADASTFSAANCATDYSSDGVADDGADGSATAATDTGTNRGADSITFGTTDGAANNLSDSEAFRGADSCASAATNTGTDRGAVATTLSAADSDTDGVSDGGAVAITLSAADDSVSNSETFATALIATDGAADSVSDGEAFRGTDDGADGTTFAAADYFAANHITATYSDSDHEYAYDVNSDVCALGLAVICSGATPYGAALQHADDRSAVATAVADPNLIADEPPVAAAEPCSLGNSDCEPDGRADSPPNALASTDHVRSVAVADSLAGSDDHAHAAGAARSARQHYLGPRHVGRQLDRRGLRRRGEHLFVVRRRHARGSRGFDRSPAAEALVVHR